MPSKSATCERTENKILLSDGFLVADMSTGEWSFECVGAPEQHGQYCIAMSRLIKSPEALIDWIAHLNEKSWFDAKKFTDFFTRLRKNNELYGSI